MKKLLFTTILIAVLFSPSFVGAVTKKFQVDTGGTLTTNLRAYYKLEDVNDFWAAYHLTNNGAATFVGGKINNGVNFVSASSQYLSTTDPLGIDGGNISMAGWVKINNAPGTDVRYSIFHQSNNTSKVNYWLEYRDAAGTKRLVFWRTRNGVADNLFTYNVALTPGTWYHIVYTYDGATVRGYLNDSAIGTVASSGTGTSNRPTGFFLGSAVDIGIYLDGMEDEVGVWSKALSTTEITDLYNGGAGQTMIEPSARKIRGVGISR